MRLFKGQSGLTLVELVVALSVLGIIMTGMLTLLVSQMRIPVKLLGEMRASQQVQKATLVLSEDGNAAQSFASGSQPDYGTFSWFELSGDTPLPVTARYYWEENKVLRVLDRGGEVSPSVVVMQPVLQYSDVAFQYVAPNWDYNAVTKTWTYTEGKVVVSTNITEERGSVYASYVATATIVADLRPQADRPVPLPGRIPPPVPPANQVTFFVSGEPTLLQGTLRSGSGGNLKFDDANYYVVRGAGSPRTVIWEVSSEVVNYTNITNVEIEFIGQSDTAGVLQELYVYNSADPEHTAGGYALSPDGAEPYSTSNTDKKMLVTLGSADIDYLNSLTTKVIRLKVKAGGTAPFDLSADELLFRVAGTPASTFSRDYVVEEVPTITAGSYNSGDVASLSVDDTAYYSVGDSSGAVQWVAISQPITLDTVSSIEVIFTARVTRSGTVQSIFVFNPANGGDGYKTTADSQFTYDAANADRTVSFFLSAADVSYVNSLFPKEVRIRVRATNSASFNLNADLLVFRVKP